MYIMCGNIHSLCNAVVSVHCSDIGLRVLTLSTSVSVSPLVTSHYWEIVMQEFSFFLCTFSCMLRPWSSWTANSDKKYMVLNGATLNVNKPRVISRKTAFLKDK